MIRTRSCLASMAAALMNIALATGAAADSSITVYADQAKILKLNGQPASVVVGNPMIADVSIQGEVLAVHGRHFGNTNLIILDHQGNELAALLVNVIRPDINNVEMFKGGAEGKMVGKFSYICAPDCESIVMPGDDNDYNAAIAGQISTKSKEALSSAQTTGQ
jgi:putative type II/III system pilus formation protein